MGTQHSGHFEERLIVTRDATVINDIKGSHQIKALRGERETAHVGLNERRDSSRARELKGLGRSICADGFPVETQRLQHSASATAGVEYRALGLPCGQISIEKGAGNEAHAQKPPELVLQVEQPSVLVALHCEQIYTIDAEAAGIGSAGLALG